MISPLPAGTIVRDRPTSRAALTAVAYGDRDP